MLGDYSCLTYNLDNLFADLLYSLTTHRSLIAKVCEEIHGAQQRIEGHFVEFMKNDIPIVLKSSAESIRLACWTTLQSFFSPNEKENFKTMDHEITQFRKYCEEILKQAAVFSIGLQSKMNMFYEKVSSQKKDNQQIKALKVKMFERTKNFQNAIQFLNKVVDDTKMHYDSFFTFFTYPLLPLSCSASTDPRNLVQPPAIDSFKKIVQRELGNEGMKYYETPEPSKDLAKGVVRNECSVKSGGNLVKLRKGEEIEIISTGFSKTWSIRRIDGKQYLLKCTNISIKTLRHAQSFKNSPRASKFQ